MHTLIATVVDGGLGSLEAISHEQLQALWTQNWNLRASARRSPRVCSLPRCRRGRFHQPQSRRCDADRTQGGGARNAKQIKIPQAAGPSYGCAPRLIYGIGPIAVLSASGRSRPCCRAATTRLAIAVSVSWRLAGLRKSASRAPSS